MGKTAEEAMFFAALHKDQEELDRLAKGTTRTEREYLTKVLSRVYDALVQAEKEAMRSGN